jgi:phospholipid/cholesterol/gamma-HCH transport system permease protein
MPLLDYIGRRTVEVVDYIGDFCCFAWRTLVWSPVGITKWRNWRLVMSQFYEIGTLSIPVVMITGLFIGMVLAVQSVEELKGMGMQGQMGAIVNLSVLRELGPVLAGVMLAGRVGGGMTAELGTMRVTEQLDALRAMGADPIRVLVAPRFVACVVLIPALVLYASFMGILGGYLISVHVYYVNGADFWRFAGVDFFDILYGPIKSVFFGAALSLICCHRAFTCAPGAAGVGRACTESFVASCMSVITLDLFLGMLLNRIHDLLGGAKAIF